MALEPERQMRVGTEAEPKEALAPASMPAPACGPDFPSPAGADLNPADLPAPLVPAAPPPAARQQQAEFGWRAVVNIVLSLAVLAMLAAVLLGAW